MHTISVPIVKGDRGFGFTVADAALGQIVKDIVQPLRFAENSSSLDNLSTKKQVKRQV